MRIDCITDDAGLEALLPQWAGLWRRVAEADPFRSPAWLMAWWWQFGTGAARVATATLGGELVGVLPLYELAEPGYRKLLPIGVSLSDYIDALVDPRVPEAVGALLGAVRDMSGWQECYLPDLPPGAMLATASCPAGLRDQRAETVACPVLALPPEIAALDTVVPRKTLRDARQAATRSAAAGGIAIETADRDRIDDFMTDLFALHERRWRARGEAGVCDDPGVRAFHRGAARALAADGMLRLYRLRLAGAVAAVYYGFTWRDRSYAYLGGFDPELPRLSPGAQIMCHAIREALAEGCREFHFLRGGEAYKYAWGAADRWNLARLLKRA